MDKQAILTHMKLIEDMLRPDGEEYMYEIENRLHTMLRDVQLSIRIHEEATDTKIPNLIGE